MKLLRTLLVVAASLALWRMLRGRTGPLRRALGLTHPLPRGFESGRPYAAVHETGHHTSAASAANEGFRDDRDVIVGENLSAVGMRPGAV